MKQNAFCSTASMAVAFFTLWVLQLDHPYHQDLVQSTNYLVAREGFKLLKPQLPWTPSTNGGTCKVWFAWCLWPLCKGQVGKPDLCFLASGLFEISQVNIKGKRVKEWEGAFDSLAAAFPLTGLLSQLCLKCPEKNRDHMLELGAGKCGGVWGCR